MPILIRNGSQSEIVSSTAFPTEQELEILLANTPELLRHEGEPVIAFVARQVDLQEAGILDLLFVNKDGLPIAVEVKLARNAQARREVVAQAVDYLSSLTTLTVDELDQRVGGKLEEALRTLVEEEDSAFDLAWQAVGTNLRAGQARLVVALDDAPSPLERIFRFLARNSQLDVQLLTVQRYSSLEVGEVFVPRSLVDPASEDGPGTSTGPRLPSPELTAIVDAYNSSAPQDAQALGKSPNYRLVRLAEWRGMRTFGTHYEFMQTKDGVGAEFHIESDVARPLSESLMPFAGKVVADGRSVLAWDQNWSSGRGRLAARFPRDTPAEVVAQAMRDLIAMTGSTVTSVLQRLQLKQADPVSGS